MDLREGLLYWGLNQILDSMKLIKVQRKTKQEKRFTQEMGMLNAKVTYIKKTFVSIPYKTVHKYRETYYGKVKACSDCVLEH